jgi:thiamine biosynthesis lipoprotein
MIKHEALGTLWYIETNPTIEKNRRFKAAVGTMIRTFEANYSRFDEHSLLSKLNKERLLRNPSAELLDMLSFGKTLYTLTNGHFNFMLGNTLVTRGYGANIAGLSSTKRVNPLVDIHQTATEVILAGDATIDFGGFGKGYLVDQLAKEFRGRWKLTDFTINTGGDVYVANSTTPEYVYLAHPTERDTHLGKVPLQNAGLCASSEQKRQWFNAADNKVYSHIVKQAESEQPSELASYVISGSMAFADAIATALLAVNGDFEQLNPKLLDSCSFLLVNGEKYGKSPAFPTIKTERQSTNYAFDLR